MRLVFVNRRSTRYGPANFAPSFECGDFAGKYLEINSKAAIYCLWECKRSLKESLKLTGFMYKMNDSNWVHSATFGSLTNGASDFVDTTTRQKNMAAFASQAVRDAINKVATPLAEPHLEINAVPRYGRFKDTSTYRGRLFLMSHLYIDYEFIVYGDTVLTRAISTPQFLTVPELSELFNIPDQLVTAQELRKGGNNQGG